MKKLDYPYIRAWGYMMNSYPYYVEGEVEQARKDKAPQNAVYRTGGMWRTFDEVTHPSTIEMLERWVKGGIADVK